MKKIGLVSIFRTGNYGGTLQAFALNFHNIHIALRKNNQEKIGR